MTKTWLVTGSSRGSRIEPHLPTGPRFRHVSPWRTT